VSHASKSSIARLRGEETSRYERSDAEFLKKEGKRKAFHTGGNSSCRVHIRQHYELYQKQCKEANIPENHWAIPHMTWKQMKEEQNGKNISKQRTLDPLRMKSAGPEVFNRDNLLHVVTQFVAVDDQVRLTIEITLDIPHQSTSHSLL
jgi:hypothetical protein